MTPIDIILLVLFGTACALIDMWATKHRNELAKEFVGVLIFLPFVALAVIGMFINGFNAVDFLIKIGSAVVIFVLWRIFIYEDVTKGITVDDFLFGKADYNMKSRKHSRIAETHLDSWMKENKVEGAKKYVVKIRAEATFFIVSDSEELAKEMAERQFKEQTVPIRIDAMLQRFE